MKNLRYQLYSILGLSMALSIAACGSNDVGYNEPDSVDDVAQELTSAPVFHTGKILVGDKPNPGVKQGSASFPVAFAGGITPIVLSTAQTEGPYADTFAFTSRGISASSFAYNVVRTDSPAWGWEQALHAGWLAVAPFEGSHAQAGRALVGGITGWRLKTITVNFPTPFATPPRVILTPHGEGYEDTFATSTRGVTTNGFSVNVWRADGDYGWAQSLQLDWMAWESKEDFARLIATDGTATVGNQLDSAVVSKRISVTFPQPFSTPPTVLLTGRGDDFDDTFAVAASDVTTDGFEAVVSRVDGTQTWGQNLRLDWFAAIENPVTDLPAAALAAPGAAQPTIPLGTVDSAFTVNGQGRPNYQIPLTVPPGTHGIEPKIALTYTGGGNGMVGVGWALAGIPTITRCARTQALEGVRGGVGGDFNDRFCLDGQRLMVTSGSYGGHGSTYSTVIESYTRVQSFDTCGQGPCRFEATDKNGNKAEFGRLANWQPLLGDGETARLWVLKKLTDVHGNYLTVDWISDSNQVYPKEIKYTLHDQVPALKLRHVKFEYENRPDQERNYTSRPDVLSIAEFTRLRLSQVKTYLGQQLVRDYRIGYTLSDASKRSLVETIRECDGAGVCLPASQFDYKSAAGTNFTVDYRAEDIYQISLKYDPGAYILPGDFNGDGKTDFIRQEHSDADNDPANTFMVYFSNGNGSFNRIIPTGANSIDEYQNDLRADHGTNLILGDYNGDGKTDFIRQAKGGWDDDMYDDFRVYLSQGDGYFTVIKRDTYVNRGQDPLWFDGRMGADRGVQIIPGDYNGDGKTDFIRLEHGDWANQDNLNNFLVYFSSGDGTFHSVNPIDVDQNTPRARYENDMKGTDVNLIPGDYNGDGRTDFIRQEKGSFDFDDNNTFQVYFSNGDGRFQVVQPVGWEYQHDLRYDDGANIIPGDYNGDGKTDFIRQEKGNFVHNQGAGIFQIYFSKGNGWFDIVPVAGADILAAEHTNIITLDYNGDGKTDFLRQEKGAWGNDSTGNLQVYVSKGDGTFDIYQHSHQDVCGGDYTNLLPGDYDGDGKSDFIRQEKAGWDDDYGGTFELHFSQGDKNVDALSNVTNGLGATLEIRYAPLTDSTIYTKGTNAPSGTIDVQGPMYVVESYHQDPGTGVEQIYTFKYAGARMNNDGHGFLGFGSIQQKNLAKNTTTTTVYNQDFPFTGSIQSQVIASGNNWLKTEYTYSETTTPAKVRRVFMTKEEITRQEMGESYRKGKTFEYDDYGNRVLTHDLGDYGHLDDDFDTCSTYDNDTWNWWLGFPRKIHVGSSCTFSDNECSCNGEIKKTELTYTARRDVSVATEWNSATNTEITTEYGHDIHGNVVSRTLPGATSSLSTVETNTYDPDYKTFIIAESRSGDGTTLTTNYVHDARFGVILQATDPNGNITAHGYDGLGREVSTSMTSPNHVLTVTTVTDWGTDALGLYRRTTARNSWEYNSWQWEKEYLDGFGRVRRTVTQGTTAGSEIVVLRSYDGSDLVYQQSLPHLQGETPVYTTTTRDWLDRLKTITDPVGNVTTLEYAVDRSCSHCAFRTITREAQGTSSERVSVRHTDARDHVIKRVDAEDRVVTFDFDRFGRQIGVTDAVGTTTFTHDSFDRVVSSTSPDKGTSTTTYLGTSGLVGSTVDARGQQITYTYDGLGRVVQKNVVGKETVSYTYDESAYQNSQGRVSTVTVVKAGQSSPSSTHSFAYTPDGRVAAEELTVDGATYSFSRKYDPQGRVRSSTYPDGTELTRSYNLQGELAALSMGGTTYAQYGNYTATGQPGVVSYGNDTQNTYAYDAAHRLSNAVTTGPNSTSLLNYAYTWDALNQIQQITDHRDSNRTQSFTYSPSGQLVQANGVYGSMSYAYDNAGNLTSKDGVSYGYSNHRVTSGSNFSANYDAAGNRTAQTRNGVNHAYTYDGENRLIEVSRNGALVNQFVYDFDGDRILKIDADGTKTIYVSEDFEVTVFSDGRRLETRYVNGPAGRVAAVSNEFASSGAMLDFERLRQTGKLFDKTSAAGLFGYVVNRARVWSTHPNAPFAGIVVLSLLLALAGARITSRQNASRLLGWLHKVFAPGATTFSRRNPLYALVIPVVLAAFVSACNRAPYEAIGQTQDELVAGANGEGYPVSGTYYFHHNHIGSSSVVTDESGGEVARAEYKPYGELYQAASPGLDIFRAKFTGKEWDKDSEVYYFNARHYDPMTGRFMSADTLIQGGTQPSTTAFNPYAYSNNSPVVYVDPSGHFFFIAIIIIAIVVGAYMGGAATNGSWDPTAWNYARWQTWVGIGVGGLAGGLSAGIGGTFAGAVAGAVIEGVAFNGLKFLSPEGSNGKEFGTNLAIDVGTGVALAGAGSMVRRSFAAKGAGGAGRRVAANTARNSADDAVRVGFRARVAEGFRQATKRPEGLRATTARLLKPLNKGFMTFAKMRYPLRNKLLDGVKQGAAGGRTGLNALVCGITFGETANAL